MLVINVKNLRLKRIDEVFVVYEDGQEVGFYFIAWERSIERKERQDRKCIVRLVKRLLLLVLDLIVLKADKNPTLRSVVVGIEEILEDNTHEVIKGTIEVL